MRRAEEWGRKVPEPPQFRAYLREVCRYVRWKRARGAVKRELLAHLKDQKEAFLKEGMEEAEAERQAVLDMGPADAVGLGMDTAYRPKRDWLLVLLALALLAGGLAVMILGWRQMGTSPILLEIREETDPIWLKHLPLWMGGGLAAFLLFYLTGPEAWLKCGWGLPAVYAAAFAVLVHWQSDPTQDGSMWGTVSVDRALRGAVKIFTLLAPVFGAMLLYRLHGTGLPGAGASLVLCLVYWGKGRGLADTEGQIAGALLFALFFCALWSGWFGGATIKHGCRTWLPPLLALLLLNGGRYYLWERINGLVYQFGNNDGWVVDILDRAKWLGASTQEIGWAMYWGDSWLLTYGVYRCGLIVLLAAAVLLALLFAGGLREAFQQRKWFGRMAVLAALGPLLLVGGVELGFALGLWAQRGSIPFAYGGYSFVASMALLGILLAVRRDAALIPGRKAESRKRSRMQAAG